MGCAMFGHVTRIGLLAAFLLIGAAVGSAMAAGGGGGGGGEGPSTASKPVDPNYRAAEQNIQTGKFNEALTLLQQVLARDPKNADAFNYLGYANRKLGNRDAALGYYNKALEIDPRHLGANEYLGELYLELGDLKKAEERLSRLDDLCFFGCSQYSQLKQAVKAYRAQPRS
jgi:tetratricopeptide (TPR) repeat protein